MHSADITAHYSVQLSDASINVDEDIPGVGRFRGEAGKNVFHTQNIMYTHKHAYTCFINLSMLEAVTAGF